MFALRMNVQLPSKILAAVSYEFLAISLNFSSLPAQEHTRVSQKHTTSEVKGLIRTCICNAFRCALWCNAAATVSTAAVRLPSPLASG